MTVVYLAWTKSGHRTLAEHSDREPVDILVAFPFAREFQQCRKHYNIGRVALDSGAFSAWNSGKTVSLSDYIGFCKDFECDEIFGLDVIWNPQATQRNLEAMWAAGVDAIPCFHGGSDWRWLDWAIQRPKIAISSRLPKKKEWVQQVFKRIHPKRVHGFAFASPAMLHAAPFDSVDASSWIFSPSAMGNWAGYTGSQMRVGARGIKDFWIEVEEHQKRSRYFAARWRNALGRIRCT